MKKRETPLPASRNLFCSKPCSSRVCFRSRYAGNCTRQTRETLSGPLRLVLRTDALPFYRLITLGPSLRHDPKRFAPSQRAILLHVGSIPVDASGGLHAIV